MTQPIRSGISRRTLLAGVAAAPLAAPLVARGQGATVKLGMQSIFSGAVALLGTSTRNAALMELDRINAGGGLAGRKVEIIFRDSKGQPQEAARVARELINTEGCDMLLDAEASSASFAVQEVARDLGVLCIHTASETSSLTADPKIRVPTAFRCARQGVHDAIVGGNFTAQVAKAKGYTRFATLSPDYSYGRETTGLYLDYVRQFKPDTELITQSWPKMGQPAFNEIITKLLQAKPQALLTLLFAGDLSSFINQGTGYAMFDQMAVFGPNIADYPVLNAVKTLPPGLYCGTRYLTSFPETPRNREWGESYRKRFGEMPTNWSWEMAVSLGFLEEGVKRAGGMNGKAIAAALPGSAIDTPFGTNGRIRMRDDHTIVDYAIGWGVSQSKDPPVSDIQPGDWGQIAELEAEWKRKNGYPV